MAGIRLAGRLASGEPELLHRESEKRTIDRTYWCVGLLASLQGREK